MPNPLDSITQDQSGDEFADVQGIAPGPDGQRRVVIATPSNRLTQAVAPEPQGDIMSLIAQIKQYLGPIANQIGVAGVQPGAEQDQLRAGRDRLLGTNGQERYQTWPEQIVRSGATLAGDVATGRDVSGLANMGLRREDVTDQPAPGGLTVTAQPGDTIRERAMDMGGLAGGGALTARPGVGTLGSGPLRTGAKAVSVEPAPVFYSALEHAATNAAQDTMSPQQWLGFLKNQPGVKAEELAWTGLPEWLGAQKGKLSKSDVKAYLDEHKVEIKDVTKSGEPFDLHAAIQDHIESYWDGERMEGNPEPTRAERVAKNREIEEDIRANPDEYELDGPFTDEGPKYSSYQLPGGENYREHLLTMPDKTKELLQARYEQVAKQQEKLEAKLIKQFKKDNDIGSGPITIQQNSALHDFLKNHPELSRLNADAMDLAKQTHVDTMGYRSSHWDEPNVLAHVRTNDRMMNNPNNRSNVHPGQSKSLHIEEIQSDWHQQGRKQGYKDGSELPATLSNIGRSFADSRVPDAPFKTTWPELALKRMIRHAAENGYDRISWTPGEAQAARYDLSKQVSEIQYNPKTNDLLVRGIAQGKGEPPVLHKGVVPPEKLPDMIGKEATDKLINKPTDKEGDLHYLEGDGLKVGGEGMREFYDKMLPKMAEKIGKAHGVKVKQTTLPGSDKTMSGLSIDRELENVYHSKIGMGADPRTSKFKADFKEWRETLEAKAAADKLAGRTEVHYFDLPQSLKDHAVGRGFPLYMSGLPFPLIPVDHDPFKKKDK